MRVALVGANARAGDAVGNQLAEKLAFFLDGGALVRVFLDDDRRIHPAVRSHAQLARVPLSDEDNSFLASADLIVVDYSQYYPMLDCLPLLAGAAARIVVDYHGVTPPALWPGYSGDALEKGLRRRGLVWCADAVWTHSRFATRDLVEATGYPSDRLFRLGYPIDADRFSPGAPEQPWARLGLENATVLLFVGRAAPNKRLPVLVEALARLADLDPPVHALVIGDTTDLYRAEMERCQRRAAELGVAGRLHFLGQVDDARLRDAYRSADLFVMPSRHEAFCIPVVEAMACGLPVVAARAGALPETVGDAGLTFRPDDAADLAEKVRRCLDDSGNRGSRIEDQESQPGLRVAVVACRYGEDLVGGAEKSLRTIGEALQRAGHQVEVFTTCLRDENDWDDQGPEGIETVGCLRVQRFALDPADREKHRRAEQDITSAGGQVPAEVAEDFLAHSLRSRRLIDALRPRMGELDAIVVGPYLFGLARDVAREFPEKTLLLPCFHDEPAARLESLRNAYERVGGVLYHSPEEQAFAEAELGLNHPGAVCLGTLVDEPPGDPARGRALVGTGRRLVVYCGRYSPHKSLPLLLEFARRYATRHPDRFTFVFLGQGETKVPAEAWARDLGFVNQPTRRDVIAAADLLVQLSRRESLSLAALEAWAQGVPVLADSGCAVLAGQIARSQGGKAIAGYEEFAAALDDLWQAPESWRELGRSGQAYGRREYSDAGRFAGRLAGAVRDLDQPLAERMRQKGLVRARAQSRAAWRERFAQVVEQVLDLEPREVREEVEVKPRAGSRTAAPGATLLVPVQVVNWGTHPVPAEGPARMVLRGVVVNEAGEPLDLPAMEVPLPDIVLPGQGLPAAMPVSAPTAPGAYFVGLRGEKFGRDPKGSALAAGARRGQAAESWFRLTVEAERSAGGPSALLAAVGSALAPAHELQRLPEDYVDVTEGLLASWKRRAKSKLLHNFKKAYVEVVARQQSAFNGHVLVALRELAECCATLEHAWNQRDTRKAERGTPENVGALLTGLHDSVESLRRSLEGTEARLDRLEQLLLKEEIES